MTASPDDRRVTVVIPTHDRPHLVARAARTATHQSGVATEVVVVDDASTDAKAVAEACRREGARVLRLDEARGPALARNSGAAAATTPWIAFLDDDDLWAPDKLRRQLDAIADTAGARWSCTATLSVDESLQAIGAQHAPRSGDIHEELRALCVVPNGSSTVLVDAELFDASGGFGVGIVRMENYECWLRLGSMSPIASVDEPLVAYQVWSGGRSTDIVAMQRALAEIARRHRAGVDESLLRDGDEQNERYFGYFQLRAGHRVEAFKHFTRLGVRFGHRRQLVNAAAALVVPQLVAARIDRKVRASVPAAWIEATDPWLAPWRAHATHAPATVG